MKQFFTYHIHSYIVWILESLSLIALQLQICTCIPIYLFVCLFCLFVCLFDCLFV